MPSTYEPIATTTLSSNQTSVSFTSITGTYTDIVIIGIASGNDGAICMRFNNTTTNYSTTTVRGNGTSTLTSSNTALSYLNGASNFSVTAGAMMTSIWNIQNYSNTNIFKTVLFRDGMTSHITGATIGLWRNTAAITRIDLSPEFGSQVFYAGSTFTLYGITAA
jgi:hypothetical protein